MNWKRTIAALTIAVGTAFAADKTASTDNKIMDQVRMKLAVDQDVKGGALDVAVKDGDVTIKGRVDSEKAKNRATRIAKKVKGVKNVDNELVVGPPS